jgi:hypothetical protein
MSIALKRVVQTCCACPSQWDAWDAEGRYYYLRYRSGIGTVTTDHDSSTDEPVARFKHGSDLAGSIRLKDFLALAGLSLVPGAEVL